MTPQVPHSLDNPVIEEVAFDAEAEALLRAAALPVDDLPGHSSIRLLGVRDGGRLVGLVGIERHPPQGLLRSLAVAGSHRGTGLGRRLVAAAEERAAAEGLESLYLLTTTAAEFFARLGYAGADRGSAPSGIAATAQFSGLCPGSATFMCRPLNDSAAAPEVLSTPRPQPPAGVDS